MNLKCSLSATRAAGGFMLAFVVTFSLASQALAVTRYSCVTTSQELQQALTDGSDGGMYSGDDIQISLAQGTYKTGAATGNKAFHFTSTAATGNLYINGGYTANCNSFTGSATLAKLDGNGNTQVLNIKKTSGEADLLEFTIQNGDSADNGGGVNINYGQVTSATQETNLFRLIIKNNHSQKLGGGFALSADSQANGAISVDSTIVVANSADINYGGGFLQNSASGQQYVTHDTVYNNTTTSQTATGGLYLKSTGAAIGYVVDSIFWSNTNIGLNLTGMQNIVEYCDYGTLAGDAPATNYGPLSVGPKFVDAANENFHLASGSPLLGATQVSFGLSYDPDGHPYAQHGDIGTYAETIFIGDFEVETF